MAWGPVLVIWRADRLGYADGPQIKVNDSAGYRVPPGTLTGPPGANGRSQSGCAHTHAPTDHGSS